MFNKNYLLYANTTNVTERVTENVNVKVENAPTIESVKLYDEYKQKAYDSITDAYTVDNGDLKYTIYIARNADLHSIVVGFKVIFGSTVIKDTITVDASKYPNGFTYQDAATEFAKSISTVLTEKLVAMTMSDKNTYNILRG